MQNKISKKPLYKTVEEQLKRKILSGMLQAGDFLPSENELCAQFKTTRMTVRQALAALVNEGYIYKQKGKGSVVAERQNSLSLLSFRGFSDVVGKTHHVPLTQQLAGPAKMRWPEGFFHELSEEEKQAGCIYLNRLRLVDEDPVMVEFTYLPDIGLDHFTEISLVANSLFETLRQRHHLDILSVEQDIRAIAAETETAELLNLQPTDAVLHIHRRYVTSRKGYYIYASLFCNTRKYALGSVIENNPIDPKII